MKFEDVVDYVRTKSGIRIILDDGFLTHPEIHFSIRMELSMFGWHAVYISPDNDETSSYGVGEMLLMNQRSRLVQENPWRCLFHELAHATGKSYVFNRPVIANRHYDFLEQAHYAAVEELIADHAAIIVLRALGISDARVEASHVLYVNDYLLKINEHMASADPSVIEREARRAADYILTNWLPGGLNVA